MNILCTFHISVSGYGKHILEVKGILCQKNPYNLVGIQKKMVKEL